ncbi:MAG: Ig-like domain-containing protein [Longimicrobiales bacterium]
MRTRNAVVTAFAAAIVLAGACAKPFSPPGGKEDRTPPRLISSSPAALSTVTKLDDPIVFAFDETLAERGVNEAAVAVSPRTRGKVHVDRKGSRIEVTTDGGWAENQIYRVILNPGIADRFGNMRKDPVEIVFSTGPPIQNTALAGLIMDRLTGRPRATDGAVEAIRRGDSATYSADVDTAGFFALRNIPAGVYDVRAFGDLNNNRRRDPSEPASVQTQMAIGATDTVYNTFSVLPADTTAPRLVRAVATDSLHVMLTFEDPIDPDSGQAIRSVSLVRAADEVPHTGTLMTQLKNIQLRLQPPAPIRVVPDSVARADSLRADSLRLANPRAGRPPQRGGAPFARDTVSLPDRDVVLTLGMPLQPKTKYTVTVSGFRNVNGLIGGGSVEFESLAAPRPQTPPGVTPVRQDTTPTDRTRRPDRR